MNKAFLRIVSLLVLGALLAVPGQAQNYRVKAERYERGVYSPETNPASVRYAVIDLGPDVDPIRLTNSGYVLCHSLSGGSKRWFQGKFETLAGGDEFGASTFDINDAGTVVGNVLLHKAGSASEYGTANQDATDAPYTWYGGTSYGIRAAAQWNAGSTAASLLEQPQIPFHIYNLAQDLYEGSATFGNAWTIDNDGHTYGQALVQYQDFTPTSGDIHLPTRWGAAHSGYDFTERKKFGDQTLVYHPEALWSDTEKRYTDRFVTEGYAYYINQVRNGVTMAEGVENGVPRSYINSLPVDFTPVTMNSQGLVLGSVVVDPASFFGYTKFLIYDHVAGTRTELPIRQSRFFAANQFNRPFAMNHRTIPVTDSSGQTVLKKSPQIVGASGAVIWEEDPKTGQYFYTSLNLLIPPDSGWNITMPKDINDNGAILCNGTYNGQPRACLLWPMNSVYVFFGVSALSGQTVSPQDSTPQRELNTYLDQVKWTDTRDGYYPVFAGTQTNPPYVLVKGAGPNAPFGRVYVYDSVNATRTEGFRSMLAMRDALSTPGAYVTFNGHANMGVGPAFTLDVGDLSGFMHICNSVAAVSAVELTTEGYNFALRPYVPNDPANEILPTAKNYVVPYVGQLRFPNNEEIREGGSFSLHGLGAYAYNYELTTREEEDASEFTLKFTLVHSSASDLPTLNYKWFYFDACNSGRDYIEPFQHGSFFYTADFYGEIESTKTFVAAVIEGKREDETVSDINKLRAFDIPVNVFHSFPR